MARLERIRLYPVKGLEGTAVDTAKILEGGTLEHDREFALFDADAVADNGNGDGNTGNIDGSPHANGVFNAKHSDRFHELDTEYDPETRTLSIGTDGEGHAFDLETDRKRAAAWFSDYFDTELKLYRNESRGFVDRRSLGPSVVSTATLETVAAWFDEMSVESARRRLRANVEVSGVPAFWEDRFVGDDTPEFEIGGVRFTGGTACARCVVPQRDPETGDPHQEFRERFVQNRKETFPNWADETAFDHYYTLMLISRISETNRGQTLSVGDTVDVPS